jgi:hypothetical protein
MERIEFYKMSIEEYPNHKDKDSLIFSVKELQKEADNLYTYISHVEDLLGNEDSSVNFTDADQVKPLIKDYDSLSKIIALGRTYWNNPKNCKGCINWTVTMFGERCTYLETDVNSPNDMYKHPECPVK